MSDCILIAVILLQLLSNVGLLLSDGAMDRRLRHIEDALWFIEKERREVAK